MSGRERAVQLVHLELPLEVGDHAEALHHRRRAPAAGEVDDELGEDVDLDVVAAGERLLEEATTRSSIENSVFLWCGLPTTPTTTRSKIRAARVITSTCPLVTGSYEPGQIAVIIVRTA